MHRWSRRANQLLDRVNLQLKIHEWENTATKAYYRWINSRLLAFCFGSH